ncbi:hypothetical protein [Stenotrophomonas sp.]|uniref:hypothetical protein n=1 Tax=Stenotrophomonas sp. TaxID=69392 RepID=UPI00289B0F48|nr:hypothetical protein [Stenotrophomonas sp.]
MADFRISKPLIKALRQLAHGQKGLDAKDYRAHVRAVGCESTLDLSRDQHQRLLQRLFALPDQPRAKGNGNAPGG